MKKKSTSRSAFFNLRVLAALLVGLTGVSLALFAANPLIRSTAAKPVKQQKYNPLAGPGNIGDISLLPPGFDCSQIPQMHLQKMENFRAHLIMKACGMSEGNHTTSPAERASTFIKNLLPRPLAYGATDVDVILPDGTFPGTVQSETYTTANPDDPTQVFVAYNDSQQAPSSYSAGAFSTDGGTTFTSIHAFPNTFGDPVVLYNKSTATWYTIWIDGGCGGGGLGGFKSTDPLNPASWTHFCVHTSSFDDRESGWVENNPSSPFFGRMYVSWNDFNTGCGAGGCLFETFSSDGGATWSTPVEVQTDTSFFSRDVQITGDMAGNGNIYIASMDEGGGFFPHNDTNYIYKSTDGGVTWTNPYIGSPFAGPGVCSSGYFAGMFTTNGCYWRHEGWGEPAVFNNVVSLVYAQHGTGNDPGDVYYIRSTDGGVTFGTPMKLNTDTTDRPQWEPNISVSPTGTLLATWYDARVSGDSDCVYGSPTSPCYQMFSRKSNDNGATWLPDDTLSDVVSPLPAQPDFNIQPTYVGDYDYGSAITVKHMTSWADGRVPINNTAQQDVFTDRELVGFSVTTSNPACGGLVIGTAPTDFVIDLSDAVNENTVDNTDFTVNGTPADSHSFQNSDTQITFHFNTSPAVQGSNTMHIPANSFTRQSDNHGNLEFQCTFRYGQQQLTVTDTVPPVGGTFTPPAPGTYQYVVDWNMAVDPTSVQTSDLQLTGNAGGTVTNVAVNGSTTTFTLSIAFGGSLTAHIAAGAITDTFGNPNADFSGNYSVSGCPPTQYVITSGTDTIVPGTTDTGNHVDDGDTLISLPFSFTLYDQTYNAVNVNSNGRLDFVCVNEPGGYITACLPPGPNQCPYDYTIFATWQDLCTDVSGGCLNNCTGCGIFTSISGNPPDQIFNIEWRTCAYGTGCTAPQQNFEVRLYQGDPNLKFEVIHGTLDPNAIPTTGQNWVSGVQGNSGAGFFTQDFCNPAANVPPSNVSATYEIPPCASPSPTPTAPPPSPTATVPPPSPTPTATATAPPRQTPTPRPRPTPHPRP